MNLGGSRGIKGHMEFWSMDPKRKFPYSLVITRVASMLSSLKTQSPKSFGTGHGLYRVEKYFRYIEVENVIQT